MPYSRIICTMAEEYKIKLDLTLPQGGLAKTNQNFAPEFFETDLCPRFLESLAKWGTYSRAAAAVDVNINQITKLRRQYPAFDLACDEAKVLYGEVLEDEAHRRAVEGNEVPIYQKGELVGTKLELSDSLLTMLLKANNPDKFSDRKRIEGADGGELKISIVKFGE